MSPDKRYEWVIDYTFSDKQGETHNGSTTRRGGDMSVKVENKVYYFIFAPFISSLEKEAEPNFGQVIFIVLGVFLIIIINKKPKVRKVKKQPYELKDYDDSIEKTFYDHE